MLWQPVQRPASSHPSYLDLLTLYLEGCVGFGPRNNLAGSDTAGENLEIGAKGVEMVAVGVKGAY